MHRHTQRHLVVIVSVVFPATQHFHVINYLCVFISNDEFDTSLRSFVCNELIRKDENKNKKKSNANRHNVVNCLVRCTAPLPRTKEERENKARNMHASALNGTRHPAAAAI